MSEPLCFLAHLASGATCLGTDRDGEAYIKVNLSRQDAAVVMKRMDELTDNFYVTLVPEERTKGRKKRPRETDGA